MPSAFADDEPEVIPQVGCPTPPLGCSPLVVPAPASPLYTQCPPQYPLPSDPNLLKYHVLPENQTWVNCVWQPDRRPFAYLQLFEASLSAYRPTDGNPRALKTWWHVAGTSDVPTFNQGGPAPDQFKTLVALMESLYNQGFRRLMLQLPAGAPWGQFEDPVVIPPRPYFSGFDFSMNQWQALPAWKQQWFADPTGPFQQWLATKNFNLPVWDPNYVSVELYFGTRIGDGTCTQIVKNDQSGGAYPIPGLEPIPNGVNTLQSRVVRWQFNEIVNQWIAILGGPFLATGDSDRRSAEYLDVRRSDHIQYVYNCVTPWIGIGVKRFWLDGASDNRLAGPALWGALELSYQPWLKQLGARISIEAVPLEARLDMDTSAPDFCTVGKVAAMAITPGVMNFVNNQWVFRASWVFNRTDTEVHFLPTVETHSLNTFMKARERGMVVSLSNPYASDPFKPAPRRFREMIKRVYSMGKIWIADFNGDGVNNQDDVSDAASAFAANMNTVPPIRAFAWGDIDENGIVDQADVALFNAAISFWDNNPNMPPPADNDPPDASKFYRDYKGPDDL